MKYLEDFKLFEYISNRKNVEFLFNKMIKEIKNKIGDFIFYYAANTKLKIENIKNENCEIVEKILNKYKKIFLERNYIVMVI
jgi:hypothetical protein